MKKNIYLIVIILISLLLVQCSKERESNAENNLQIKIVDFLNNKKLNTTKFQANKIASLLKNLSSNSNLKQINIGGVNLIISDLVAYRNVHKTDFKNTFYKVSFPVINDKIVSTLIYTIHTDLEKSEIDTDIEKIIAGESNKFSGEIITNSLNDRFIQAYSAKEGKVEKMFDLSFSPSESDSKSSSNTVGLVCTNYYLATTIIYPDGHSERTTEFLFSVCDGCHIVGQTVDYLDTECDPDAGGGGINVEETTSSTEISLEDDEIYGTAPKVEYRFHATARRVNGEIIAVFIDPTTVSNPVVFYVDDYGRTVTRTITLLYHLNSWTTQGPFAVVKHSCLVHGKWIYSNGNPVYTRQWSKSNSMTL